MTTNRWIENSRNVYTILLSFYPKEHRDDYGVSMKQVFAEQCRSTYQQKGAFGLLLLWLRTLPDLIHTALLEHITSPSAGWGLMEPVPNAPLPWKGVLLVLLPGLVYLVGQIAQLTGQPWYMGIYYRAGFFLILPVLAVWAITRRFPIWGLIPVGLFYTLFQEVGYYLITSHPDVFSSNPLLNMVLTAAKQVQNDLMIPVGVFSVAIVLLAWRYARQQKPSRSFWIMVGIYLLVIGIQIGREYWNFWVMTNNLEISSYYLPGELQKLLYNSIVWNLYNYSALLLLIFSGTLFVRRHGFFTILILVGYFLPTILVGLEDENSTSLSLVLISGAVLAYRVILSLIVPVWMSRTSSQAGKKRVILISIAIALGIYTVMQFYPNMALYLDQSSYQAQNNYMAQSVISQVALDDMKFISAILLGMVLYQSHLPAGAGPVHTPVETPEQAIEKSIKVIKQG